MRNLRFFFPILIVVLLAMRQETGWCQKSSLQQAREYEEQSRDYYQRALKAYEGLISGGKDLDRLYFELGKVHYDHGEFESAVDAFKKSNEPKAKKYLAICYLRLGLFTDALEIFNSEHS